MTCAKGGMKERRESMDSWRYESALQTLAKKIFNT